MGDWVCKKCATINHCICPDKITALEARIVELEDAIRAHRKKWEYAEAGVKGAHPDDEALYSVLKEEK
jgi:hypothetical protein